MSEENARGEPSRRVNTKMAFSRTETMPSTKTCHLEDLNKTKRMNFWRTFNRCFIYLVYDQILYEGGTAFPHDIGVLHVDMINMVYQSLFQAYQCKIVHECILYTLARKMLPLISGQKLLQLNRMFLHFDIAVVRIRQKTTEQVRRSALRNSNGLDVRKHHFNEGFTFSWS